MTVSESCSLPILGRYRTKYLTPAGPQCAAQFEPIQKIVLFFFIWRSHNCQHFHVSANRTFFHKPSAQSGKSAKKCWITGLQLRQLSQLFTTFVNKHSVNSSFAKAHAHETSWSHVWNGLPSMSLSINTPILFVENQIFYNKGVHLTLS